MLFDCFPFFNELDILEIRLNELDALVDRFIIVESAETYGGDPKPYHLLRALAAGRFYEFRDKMTVLAVEGLEPKCTDRTTGRLREADQRNQIWDSLMLLSQSPFDRFIFSDCDEIPSAYAVMEAAQLLAAGSGPIRFKQDSYYYNVHTRVDYGNDFASRARMGTVLHLAEAGSMYKFRMADALPIEHGGWHFSYFGGPENIKTKVAAVAPFLREYKLFGDEQLQEDIEERRDLHHRRCEMPPVFEHVPEPKLPAYLQANRDRFAHFFKTAVLA